MSDDNALTIKSPTGATSEPVVFTVEDIPRLLADQAAMLRYIERLEKLVECKTCIEGKIKRVFLDEDGVLAEISGEPGRWGHSRDGAHWYCGDDPVVREPKAAPGPDEDDGLPGVAGDECTILPAELEYRCRVAIAEEQEKTFPDNMLIALLCDSVRLAREYENNRKVLPMDDQMYTLRLARYWLEAAHAAEDGARARFLTKEALNVVRNALVRP